MKRRIQISLLDGLDQIGQDVIGFRPVDQRGIMIGRDEDDRHGTLALDPRGGFDTIGSGHLDVGDDQVGEHFPTALD